LPGLLRGDVTGVTDDFLSPDDHTPAAGEDAENEVDPDEAPDADVVEPD
jgi:hypothetical protein